MKNLREIKEQEKKLSAKKVALLVFLVVMVVFIGILCFTEFLGWKFGKSVENICLIVFAIILGIMLYFTKRS